MIRPLVSSAWLEAELDNPGIRIVDARWYLADGGQGRREYEAGHIPGAIHLDLETDLSAKRGPGRHPLPDNREFSNTLGSTGVGNDHHVIVYDHGPGSIAARTWWMLRHVGHHKVSLLDGGFRIWQESGYESTRTVPTFASEVFNPGLPANSTIERDELLSNLGDVHLIDARSEDRYRGTSEPIDAAAGHIPTAISAPTSGNLDGDGRFKSPEQLAARYTALGIDTSQLVVSSCGSGVTACHNILAMHIAGFPEAVLYPGSWSDWSASSFPIATGGRPGFAPGKS